MSEEAQRVYLTNKMKAGENQLAFGVAYPNQPFNIPKNSAYGEFHIIAGPKPIIVGGEGKGKARVRHVGMVQLTVWIPEDKGTKIGTTAGDVFEKLFQLKQGRDAAGYTYKFDLIQPYSPQVKTGWTCLVYRVPFTRDSVKPVQITI